MTTLHTAAFLARVLALVMAFASWVLAAISIRHVESRWGTYFSVDPAMVRLVASPRLARGERHR